MKDVRVSYVLDQLAGFDGGGESLGRFIAYSPVRDPDRKHKIRIVPSGFFDASQNVAKSVPPLPLHAIEGVPLLFGEPVAYAEEGEWVVHADLVASAYFLLTRYEELIRREVRDDHGRFPGRESLPFRAGFLHRPIVDEYAALLRKWLGAVGVCLADPPRKIRKIHLTHDVDAPWAWPTFRSAVRAAASSVFARPARCWVPLLSYWGLAENRDPHDCFQWMLEQDAALRDSPGVPQVESTYFLLAGGGGPHDGSDYLNDGRMEKLIGKIKGGGASIGLHGSYAAGIDPGRLPAEKARLERAAGCPCRSNRHHFLASREPEDLAALEAAGIADDFTMGYADMAGFRLGTCRPVPWFDPVARRRTSLTLHPMTIMECTLDRKNYMNLDYERAKSVCYALLAEVRKHNGEAVLLWHNTELSEQAAASGSYQRKLYLDVLDQLRACS